MSRWDKVCQLHSLLDRRRQPLDRNTLCSELDCSPATLTRLIATLRNEFGAPIENLPGTGWHYGADVRDRFELPGLWLSDDELHALALLDQLLGQIGPEPSPAQQYALSATTPRQKQAGYLTDTCARRLPACSIHKTRLESRHDVSNGRTIFKGRTGFHRQR